MITQQRLKELFHYCGKSGVFIRLLYLGGLSKVGDVVGYRDKKGYLNTNINRKHYKMHRLAWLYVHGEFPADQIDHINGVRDDNRIDNLRSVTGAENAKNQKTHITNMSGVCGISWCNREKKWRTRIKVDGKQKYLGRFKDIELATLVRKEAEIKYGYHKNHGRAS